MAHFIVKIFKNLNNIGHLSYACLTKSRQRRHSYSDNRSGPSQDKKAESHSVEASASNCWGHDPNWVRSLIESTIHNEKVEARASNVTANEPEDSEEEGNLGGW